MVGPADIETPIDEKKDSIHSTNINFDDLTARMAQVWTQHQTQTHTPTVDSSAAPIGIRLDGTNYALWSQVVEMYISGKDKLGYINGDIPQPQSTDPTFRKWRTENAIVKGWLINSMEPALISNFIQFPTAKMVWDSIATTYFDGTDTSQVYNLKWQVTRMRQGGGSIEKYYNDLQGLWREIDFRRPNPMKCTTDISKYNSILQEDRVYIFLDGLDDRLDKIRSDVLQLQSFPTVEQAYAHVRREDIRQAVMMTGMEATTGAVMASKGVKTGKQQSLPLQMSPATNSGKMHKNIKAKGSSEEGGCTHCGNMKHTRETCFKLHGYPEWWNELKARKQREATANGNLGQAALMNAEPQLSLTSHVESSDTLNTSNMQGNYGHALLSSNQSDHSGWIIDSGATDHMTFDSTEFIKVTQPRRTSIANVNGVTYPDTGLELLLCHLLFLYLMLY